ncbi:hypothetical protein N7495_006341 [Penicillium taxi]|uniref:uncharacterized protein n=1 Tax=Penicillium taxi TaxID=168475 RepID=UPI0025454053|nr:uncharacterized protein N7495_006341 [Penicillium taxi]KAJ5894650.1 hypothetical protein N7495_006341 [Penicillium taxi]
MSATLTSTLATTTLVGTPSAMAMTTFATLSEKHCPTCGSVSDFSDLAEAQRRIHELEEQVYYLTDRAAETAGKLADYEDEVHRLRRPQSGSSRPTSSSSSPDNKSQTSSRFTTLASLLPYRRGSATPSNSTPAPDTPATLPPNLLQLQSQTSEEDGETSELQNALTREKDLRKAAETQLSQASTELEDLTVQLFSQANEMVAEERKARAKLEERIAVLERRDTEKRNRLERLEKSMARVEKLRALIDS